MFKFSFVNAEAKYSFKVQAISLSLNYKMTFLSLIGPMLFFISVLLLTNAKNSLWLSLKFVATLIFFLRLSLLVSGERERGEGGEKNYYKKIFMKVCQI